MNQTPYDNRKPFLLEVEPRAYKDPVFEHANPEVRKAIDTLLLANPEVRKAIDTLLLEEAKEHGPFGRGGRLFATGNERNEYQQRVKGIAPFVAMARQVNPHASRTPPPSGAPATIPRSPRCTSRRRAFPPTSTRASGRLLPGSAA